ncbi:MAG: 4Fe-4S dicluster domain-containing protein [Gammaproteobacteria bacterium]|nr:4Fe-4S dicluster domain-containing protein [Gammaproteobacteria bacterium]NIU05478.1 4Fe-4S dicluster domain-containing protein [Gammaproteobacteria bacterium]NIX86751.1 4Fe-4S dicluster domain-containing protein [Gammaproteobacteria bacterium]
MSADGPTDPSRRRFLGQAAAAAMVTVAPGIFLFDSARARRSPGEPVTSAVRWGLLVDTTRCGRGCDACVSACRTENGWDGHGRPRTDAQWIRKVEVRDSSTGHAFTLPMMCQHCEQPPCVDVCPTGASFRRADGIVLVDKHICIGCRYCMMACPYKARSFVHEDLEDQKPYAPRGKGTVESCTMCVHRLDAGRSPACVEACADEGGAAIIFGDLNDPDSEISRRLAAHGGREIRADLGLNTGVLYQGI